MFGSEINWNSELFGYFEKFADLWQYKASISAGVTALLMLCDVDVTLVFLAMVILCIEFVMRFVTYLKCKHDLMKGLQKGVARFAYYGFVFAVSVFMQTTITHTIGFKIPVTDWILGWLILTDLVSVLTFARLLFGFKPPHILQIFLEQKRNFISNRLTHGKGEAKANDIDEKFPDIDEKP